MTGRPAGSFSVAVTIFVAGGVAQYGGYAVAVRAFDDLPPVPSAWMRSLLSGIFLYVAVAVTGGAGDQRAGLRDATVFGGTVFVMNLGSFVACGRLQLGVVTALEFVGPICLCIALSRSLPAYIAAMTTGLGVVLLLLPGAVSGAELDAVGVLAALTSAAMWALYIVLGGRFGTARSAVDALSRGLVVTSVAMAPLLGGVVALSGESRPAFSSEVVAWGVVIALAASVVPYAVDQWCINRWGSRVFSLLVAVLPVVSAGIGVVTLGQRLTLWQWAGVVVVATSLVLARWSHGSLSSSRHPQRWRTDGGAGSRARGT